MTRKELVAVLSEHFLLSRSNSAALVDLVFEVIADALGRGEEIEIPGFGNFGVREKRARRGRNPQTGERKQIAARRVVTFKPSPTLRKTLNKVG